MALLQQKLARRVAVNPLYYEKDIKGIPFPAPEPFVKAPYGKAHVPKLSGALKLLVNPEADLGLMSRVDNEVLGANLVTNGDFHDFTFGTDANTVALWVFDDVYHAQEATGKTVVQDLAGSHDLSIAGWTDYNDLLTDLTGSNPAYQNGKALNFPGVNERLYISSTDFNPGAGDFTIEVWYKSSVTDAVRRGLFTKKQKPTAGFPGHAATLKGNIGELTFAINDGTNAASAVYTNTATSDGNPHHVVFIRSGNTIYIYFDAVQVASGDASLVGSLDSTEPFIIGLNATNGSDYWAAEISSVRYSNVARTAQQIKESYGLAKNWTWDGTGSVSNSNFSQVVSGGGAVTQTVSTTSGNLYKKKLSTDGTASVSYLNETNHVISLGNGTHDDISVKQVLNASWSGTTVQDYSGNGNDGTMQGLMEQGQPIHPAAWKFDGIDDYVDFGDILDLKTYDGLVFFWAKAPNDVSAKAILSKASAASRGWLTYFENSDIKARLGDGTTVKETTATVDVTELAFYAAVYDRDGNLEIYRNGTLLGSIDISALNTNLDYSTRAVLGAYDNGASIAGYHSDIIGISGVYIFDGQNGASSRLPDNYEQLIKFIYYTQKEKYLRPGR